MWMDKRLVQLMSTIHDATVVNTGKNDRTTEIQKPYTAFKYHKFMKGILRADKYLSYLYYSVLRKTVKWPNVFAKWCTLQCIFVYKTLNTKKK
jgi:hypothetical protein